MSDEKTINVSNRWRVVLVPPGQALGWHPCPNAACGHGEDDHTFVGICRECDCGQSHVIDRQARQAAIGIPGSYTMTEEESIARGFRAPKDLP